MLTFIVLLIIVTIVDNEHKTRQKKKIERSILEFENVLVLEVLQCLLYLHFHIFLSLLEVIKKI